MDTLMLPLSAGMSMISIPLQTQSQLLSDLFPNLPNGSRVWTWDATGQQFVEGFDQSLSLGQGAFLYVPAPALITVSGTAPVSDQIPMDLAPGWNLIGVPYNVALPRSAQSVMVDQFDTPFNDAVDQGAIADVVFSLDLNGYQQIGPDDSFQPMHAYWVYSTDQSLLELEQKLLACECTPQSAPNLIAQKIGGAIVTWGVGQFLTWLEPNQPDPLDVVNAKLDALAKQLDDIQEAQTLTLNAVQALATKLDASTAKIISETQNQRVLDVQTQLTSHFGDEKNRTFFTSLAYFEDQAANRRPVPQDQLTQFAWNVLYNWQFVNQYNDINTAIVGNGTGGVLNSWADWVVSSDKGTLLQRYTLMQNYFNYLLSLQTKCAVLITNAYNVLATVPPYNGTPAPPAGEGERWRTAAYNNTILSELDIFRAAVESIAARKLSVPQSNDGNQLVIPGEVQKMMGMADVTIMAVGAEPPGLRVHMLVNPGAFTTATMNVETGGTFKRVIQNVGCLSTSNPPCPANEWTTVTGPSPYDDWSLNSSLPTYRQLNITRDWKLGRFILPVSPSDLRGQATLNVPLRLQAQPVQWSVNRDNPRAATVVYVDPETGAQSASGTLFGSVILANRPTANSVFDGCIVGGDVSKTTEYSRGDTRVNIGCNRVDIFNCSPAIFPALQCAAANITIPFVYAGAQPATVAVTTTSTYTWDGRCGDQTYGQLLNTIGSPLKTLFGRLLLTGDLALMPQQKYSYVLSLTANRASTGSDLCGTTLKYGGAFMQPK